LKYIELIVLKTIHSRPGARNVFLSQNHPEFWRGRKKQLLITYIDYAWVMYPLGDVVGQFLGTFKEYPPRMKAGSWDMSKALEALQTPHNK
jgi:hypothetical protein